MVGQELQHRTAHRHLSLAPCLSHLWAISIFALRAHASSSAVAASVSGCTGRHAGQWDRDASAHVQVPASSAALFLLPRLVYNVASVLSLSDYQQPHLRHIWTAHACVVLDQPPHLYSQLSHGCQLCHRLACFALTPKLLDSTGHIHAYLDLRLHASRWQVARLGGRTAAAAAAAATAAMAVASIAMMAAGT